MAIDERDMKNTIVTTKDLPIDYGVMSFGGEKPVEGMPKQYATCVMHGSYLKHVIQSIILPVCQSLCGGGCH